MRAAESNRCRKIDTSMDTGYLSSIARTATMDSNWARCEVRRLRQKGICEMLWHFLPAQVGQNMPVRMFSKVSSRGSGDGFRLQRMIIRSRRIFENSWQTRIQDRNQLPLQ